MLISDLIARLQELQEEHGDVEVCDDEAREIEEAAFRETDESWDSRMARWVELSP